MKRTPWPVLERLYKLSRLFLFLLCMSPITSLLAGESHHMVISTNEDLRVGNNQITISVQTKENLSNPSDNRQIKLDIYSDNLETRTVQLSGGVATVELNLKKGPSLIVASDPSDPLFIAYKDIMVQDAGDLQ